MDCVFVAHMEKYPFHKVCFLPWDVPCMLAFFSEDNLFWTCYKTSQITGKDGRTYKIAKYENFCFWLAKFGHFEILKTRKWRRLYLTESNICTVSFCWLLGKSPWRSELLYSKAATIGSFEANGMMMPLHKKMPYCLLEILKYLCTSKCLEKYQRLQLYGLYVPIFDETPFICSNEMHSNLVQVSFLKNHITLAL